MKRKLISAAAAMLMAASLWSCALPLPGGDEEEYEPPAPVSESRDSGKKKSEKKESGGTDRNGKPYDKDSEEFVKYNTDDGIFTYSVPDRPDLIKAVNNDEETYFVFVNSAEDYEYIGDIRVRSIEGSGFDRDAVFDLMEDWLVDTEDELTRQDYRLNGRDAVIFSTGPDEPLKAKTEDLDTYEIICISYENNYIEISGHYSSYNKETEKYENREQYYEQQLILRDIIASIKEN